MQLLKLLKYAARHPFKSILFIVKLYISFILFGLFMMVSFSSFAELVPADKPRGAVYEPSWYVPFDNRDAGKIVCDYHRSKSTTSSCTVSEVSEITAAKYTVKYTLVKTDNTSANRSDTLYFYLSNEAATCPPSGYPTYTTEVWQGDTLYCEGEGGGGTDPEPPYVEQVPLDCISRAGTSTTPYYHYSETQLTQEERDELSCMRFFDNKGNLYNERCHVTSTESNTVENQDPDSGLWQYTLVGGTFSGYQCNEADVPIAEDKFCTALSNEGVHSVRCPDGSSMSLDMNPYDAYNQAFLIFRGQAQNDINELYNNLKTTEEIAQELMQNSDYKDAVTGKSCQTTIAHEGGYTLRCGDSPEVTIRHGVNGVNGSAGSDGADGEDGESCQTIQEGKNLRIVCPESVAVVSSGTDGTNGVDGEDGESCTSSDTGNGDITITCGSKVSTLNGIDEDGVIAAINGLGDELGYEGGVPNGGFGTGAVSAFVGEANNYEERNYGTVMQAAITQMKESPLVESVDSFFDVTITGSCPTYTADLSFMQTSVVFDHWCRPVMESIWPMVQGVIILLFSIIGFRAAIL